MAPLNLPVGAAGITVQVHSGVLFNICDAYIRRNENQGRVIGTLLGSVADGVVDVRNSYAVPHDESQDRVRRGLLANHQVFPATLQLWTPRHNDAVPDRVRAA